MECIESSLKVQKNHGLLKCVQKLLLRGQFSLKGLLPVQGLKVLAVLGEQKETFTETTDT